MGLSRIVRIFTPESGQSHAFVREGGREPGGCLRRGFWVVLVVLLVAGCGSEKKMMMGKMDGIEAKLQALDWKVAELSEKVDTLVAATLQKTKRDNDVYESVAGLCDIFKGLLRLEKLRASENEATL